MMKKFAEIFFAALLVLALAFPLPAVDFGLLTTQSVSLDDAFSGDMSKLSWSGAFTPWFSGMLIENGDLYMSIGITPKYENDDFVLIPELLRTEVALRSDRGTDLRFGRISYVDPLGLIAVGLFDGFQVSQDIGEGILSAGAWYTGLQYKKRANITVSPSDRIGYFIAFDKTSMDTYFAPQRMLAAVGWEHPALAGAMQLHVAAIGQFDVNGENDTYNSEYFVGKISVPFRNLFVFDAGAGVEFLQTPDEDTTLALVGELGVSWMPPTNFQDRLSLIGRFSTGDVDDSPLGAFMPLTTVSQGNVLQAKLSALAHLRADYTARLHEMFSVNTALAYFLRTSRNENENLTWPEVTDEDMYVLGGEVFMSLLFSLTSDIGINLGGGVFLPQMGNVAPREREQWRFEMGITAALF
ncbi:MAG: hypothetical protein LBD47_10615 [Treponema sp.]|jgi:hypothetical protein|nr:hypothetical protein [Treponema sp.]